MLEVLVGGVVERLGGHGGFCGVCGGDTRGEHVGRGPGREGATHRHAPRSLRPNLLPMKRLLRKEKRESNSVLKAQRRDEVEVSSRATALTAGEAGPLPGAPRGPGTPRAEGLQDIMGLSGHTGMRGNGSIRNLSINRDKHRKCSEAETKSLSL